MRRGVLSQTALSYLFLLVVLILVVQAQLDQVHHHAQHMLRHVLMIHPDLEHIKLLVFPEEQTHFTLYYQVYYSKLKLCNATISSQDLNIVVGLMPFNQAVQLGFNVDQLGRG